MKEARIYNECSSDPTGIMLAEEVNRKRAEIRHAHAMTPLATVPLAQGKRHARRPGAIRPRPQVMRIRIKRQVY